MKYSLDRPSALRYEDEKILEELKRVAKIYDYHRFTRHDFDNEAIYCKGSVVLNRFDTWQAALYATDLELKPAKKKDQYQISNSQLFFEMERIWHKVEHRPSKGEWGFHKPKYSYTTYKTRFNGWLNACAAFIEYISGEVDPDEEIKPKNESKLKNKTKIKTEDRRDIPLKLRYKVLVRDNFRCVLCGRSPAIERCVRLHIDHIVPFSKGGKTEEENLRTLCENCNWGKGDEQVEG